MLNTLLDTSLSISIIFQNSQMSAKRSTKLRNLNRKKNSRHFYHSKGSSMLEMFGGGLRGACLQFRTMGMEQSNRRDEVH